MRVTDDYLGYMDSRDWRRLRADALLRAEATCERCGRQGETGAGEGLQVHHRTYERLGCEQPQDLEVLCRTCHKTADRERRARTGWPYVDINRLALPLLEPHTGSAPTTSRDLQVDRCDVTHARRLNAEWHSRLPETQVGPWMAAYRAAHDGVTYAVGLWNSPSARTLPAGCIELRRMAVAPDAPHCTASRFLNQMVRRLRTEFPTIKRAISYQDRAVHTGTIYRAAGWTAAYVSEPRVRDRSGRRAGTRRAYRWNMNGNEPDAAGKVRWEMVVR